MPSLLNLTIRFGAAAVLASALSLSGCTFPSRSLAPSQGVSGLKKLNLTSSRQISRPWTPALSRGGAPIILAQTTLPPESADTTSGATPKEEAEKASGSEPEAVSSASVVEESAVKDAAYCLKCHGPFEKLAQGTADYVTEWDEKANPHCYVPHDTVQIVECAECHDTHTIPYQSTPEQRIPDVKYCYSCHHTESLVTCTECHKD
jgi:hypothetical protein